MSNSEVTLLNVEQKPTRRAVLQGAAAAAAAVLAPSIVVAQSHDAEGSRYLADKPFASISKNVVETDSGKVSGFESGGIVTFKGIPYGATTEGRGRFMPPTKPTPWAGVRSAWHWGWVSPQNLNASLTGRRNGWAHDDESFMFQWDDGNPSEDCLRINVWTPALDNRKRPVMFWIHGGQFLNGSSNEMACYDGENLARRGDVVVVSINHRLGVLGYMNLMDYGAEYSSSPNVGQLDLIQALQWVKTNISNFGGDPNTVMIFGQSGGGAKTSCLMGMPTAAGLFHRAAIQSSGDPIHQATADNAAQLTAAVLKELGISKGGISKIHELPYQTIVEAGVRAQRGAAAGHYYGVFQPVVDGHLLPRHSWDPAAPEPSATVPLLTGSLLNEMGNSIQMGDASLEDMSDAEMQKRVTAQYKGHAAQIIDSMRQLHPNSKPFDIYSYIQGMPRRVFSTKMTMLKAAQAKAPAYNYLFQWQTPVLDSRPRSYHCAELPFVFFNSERASSMTGGGPVPMALGEKMADAWISFARTGNPNHKGIPNWPAVAPTEVSTMVFDNTCVVKKDHDTAQRNAVASANA
jgi:para-nitrobenzyl esterase